MRPIEIKQGVKVFISDNPTHTARTHTIIPTMTEMAGKEYIIERAVMSSYGLAADIKKFWWHPKDLTLIKSTTKKPVKDTKKIVPVLFNPKELFL